MAVTIRFFNPEKSFQHAPGLSVARRTGLGGAGPFGNLQPDIGCGQSCRPKRPAPPTIPSPAPSVARAICRSKDWGRIAAPGHWLVMMALRGRSASLANIASRPIRKLSGVSLRSTDTSAKRDPQRAGNLRGALEWGAAQGRSGCSQAWRRENGRIRAQERLAERPVNNMRRLKT